MIVILQELEKWLEAQIADAKQDIDLEIGEGVFRPMGRLEAFKKVLDYVRSAR